MLKYTKKKNPVSGYEKEKKKKKASGKKAFFKFVPPETRDLLHARNTRRKHTHFVLETDVTPGHHVTI